VCLAELGRFPEAAAFGREALELAESAEHVATLISACFGLGRLHLRQADFERAIPVLERGLNLTRVWNFRLWLPGLAEDLGAAHICSGRAREAIAILGEAVEVHGAMRGTAGQSRRLTSLGEAYLRAGQPAEAAVLAERALALARANEERGNEAWALWLQAEVAAHAPGGAGEAAYERSMALARELGMRPLEAHCQLGLGRIQRMAHHPDAARQSLGAVIALFGELGMDTLRAEAEAELEHLPLTADRAPSSSRHTH